MALYSHINTYAARWYPPGEPEDDECVFLANHYDMVCTFGTAIAKIKAERAGCTCITVSTWNTLEKYTEWDYEWWRTYWGTHAASDRDDSMYLHMAADYTYTTNQKYVDDGGAVVRRDNQFDFLWHYNGSEYTDLRYANSTTLLTDADDYLYMGYSEGPFREINFAGLATWGSGLTLEWTYWDGDSWAALSVTDETSALAAPGRVSFVPPADWVRCKVNTGSEDWTSSFVRVRATAGTTRPVTAASGYGTSQITCEKFILRNAGNTGYLFKGWDAANDADDDGYAESPENNTNATARFAYQARFPITEYIPIDTAARRYCLNLASADVRTAIGARIAWWIGEEGADGCWMDDGGTGTWQNYSSEMPVALTDATSGWYAYSAATLAAIRAANPTAVLYLNMGEIYDREVLGTPDAYDRNENYGASVDGFYQESRAFAYFTRSHHERYLSSALDQVTNHLDNLVVETRADRGFASVRVTDLACADHVADGGYTVTSVTGGFTADMVAQYLYVANASGGNWTTGTSYNSTCALYTISSVVDGNTLTLTADPTNGSDATGGIAYIGGTDYLDNGYTGWCGDSINLGQVDQERNKIFCLAGYYCQLAVPPNANTYYCFGARNVAGGVHFKYVDHEVYNWYGAIEFDIGTPVGNYTLWATGNDPVSVAAETSPVSTYNIWSRRFSGGDWVGDRQALVLFKPRSYNDRSYVSDVTDATATTHDLDGTYKPLNADGTLGDAITSISLRNSEGAILIPSGDAPDPSGDPPTVTYFVATPSVIRPGGQSVLSWYITEADGVTIDQGVGSVLFPEDSVAVSPVRTVTYTLTATNEYGSTPSTVTVYMQNGKAA